MQLVAYGAQDIYLTGNPMITYFKVVYRRHTNFAMESIQQTFNGRADFGQKVSALISRNGDLINGVVLEATLPPLPDAGNDGVDMEHRWIDNVGHYLMSNIVVEIGGQTIDEHYSDWLEIWSQLTIPAGQREGYLKMIGQDPKDSIGQPTGLQNPGSTMSMTGRKIYVPLQFWFCRNIGLALPLIALQYHEVKINITFSAASALYNDHKQIDVDEDGIGTTLALTAGLSDVSLWVDYIYLDTDERRRFAQVSHEYLIEQLQTNDGESFSTTGAARTSVPLSLTFNHPIKELIWVCKSRLVSGVTVVNQPNNYTTAVANTNQVPVKNFVPAIRLTAISAATETVTAGSHTHGLDAAGVTGATGNDTGHTHGAGSLDVTGTTDTAGAHVHKYSRITDIKVRLDYGNFENETGQNRPSAEVTVPYDVADYNEGTDVDDVPSTAFVDTAAITLAALTTAHNYTLPITDDVHGANPVASAKLMLNGHDRMAQRDGTYFNMMTTKACHTNIPASPGINVYSFALKPEDHQPSGTCNFSRIDNARLQLFIAFPDSTGANSGVVTVYAVNYNVLRIMSGMGGLAYSN